MNSQPKIALAQINPVVGDLAGNADLILEAVAQARAAGADLLLTPELALCGYPPEDLLLRPDFIARCEHECERILAHTEGITVVLGHPRQVGERCYNAASVMRDGVLLAVYDKQVLPNYGVFDELRYFTPGQAPCVFEVAGVRVGLCICEDAWEEAPPRAARAAGAQLLVSIHASPFHVGKRDQRLAAMRRLVRDTGLPLVYCNAHGGQDELVFDGASFALDADGGLAYQAPSFAREMGVLCLADGRWEGATLAAAMGAEEEMYAALVTGVRDYIDKNGFPGVLIGMSGGIDSALTLAVAVDALGAERVRAVMMPSPYTAQMSLNDSRDMVQRLGVRYEEISIGPAMTAFDDLLAEQFRGLPEDTTEENLQSRIRAVILMAMSNKTGWLVLITGNKSEVATGYSTLYGDMAGGFAVLKDVYKCSVYALSRWRNTVAEVIPPNIITRPPSAELKPDQYDQDSLPPYEVLDAIIEGYMERNESPHELIARGFDEAAVRRTVRLLKISEYKRRQAPVGVRVTPRAFGKDWRYPITSRAQDTF